MKKLYSAHEKSTKLATIMESWNFEAWGFLGGNIREDNDQELGLSVTF